MTCLVQREKQVTLLLGDAGLHNSSKISVSMVHPLQTFRYLAVELADTLFLSLYTGFIRSIGPGPLDLLAQSPFPIADLVRFGECSPEFGMGQR